MLIVEDASAHEQTKDVPWVVTYREYLVSCYWTKTEVSLAGILDFLNLKYSWKSPSSGNRIPLDPHTGI